MTEPQSCFGIRLDDILSLKCLKRSNEVTVSLSKQACIMELYTHHAAFLPSPLIPHAHTHTQKQLLEVEGSSSQMGIECSSRSQGR